MADVNEIIASLRREGRHGPLIEPLVPRNAAAADALEAYKSAVENVLALHVMEYDELSERNRCRECAFEDWTEPSCPTVKAITDALNGEQA